ncbi:MAG: alpha/beta hydrolase [Parvibaculaceae bacterium]|nr:alpha/beta hydrolase [Parvibaculaceae bacterium]HBM89813.1 alpha/beta hydrolase [Rhodobiaceae bacterium]
MGIFVETPDLPCPPGGVPGWLVCPDGSRMRTMVWSPDHASAPCRGTIVLASGRTEFIEKYFEVIASFLERGFAVATFDWRGQGLSERMLNDRRKGHVDEFSTFDADFIAFMKEVVEPLLPEPYIGVGHSMGGNLMLRAGHNLPNRFAGIVLSAPMLGLNVGSPLQEKATRWLVSFLNLLGKHASFAPGGGPKAVDEEVFEENIVTSDPDRHARLKEMVAKAPSLGLGSPTIGWVHQAFKSVDEIADPAYLSAITTPVLLFEAGADKLVRGGSIRQVADGLPNGEYVLVEGAEHEILMEQEQYQQVFWTAFDAFTKQVLSSSEAKASVNA